MILKRLTHGVITGLVGILLVMGCAAIAASTAETPGERFRGIMEEMAKLCVEKKLKPTDSRCSLPKLKPADPLATPEGRFAHSIKIPNPVPEDSGYKPGMTPQEYFDHLCKTEAGEFIYKTVENVEGLYLMRLRKRATDYELEHLYALEDPYGEVSGEYHSPKEYFVQPHMGKYQFIEMPLAKVGSQQDGSRHRRYYRDENAHPGKKYQTAIDGRAVFVPYIVAEEEASPLKSKYGVTWRGIIRSHDRELGIAGSELIVLDLQTNEVLAVRRGFIRSGGVRNNLTSVWWLTGQTCPKLTQKPNHWFIREVLKPATDSKMKEK